MNSLQYCDFNMHSDSSSIPGFQSDFPLLNFRAMDTADWWYVHSLQAHQSSLGPPQSQHDSYESGVRTHSPIEHQQIMHHTASPHTWDPFTNRVTVGSQATRHGRSPRPEDEVFLPSGLYRIIYVGAPWSYARTLVQQLLVLTTTPHVAFIYANGNFALLGVSGPGKQGTRVSHHSSSIGCCCVSVSAFKGKSEGCTACEFRLCVVAYATQGQGMHTFSLCQ